MTTKITGILLCLLFSAALFAQTSSLQIEIRNSENNQTLTGATLYLENLKIAAFTNLEGLATLSDIPLGNHQISISLGGFKTIKDTIEITVSNSLKTYKMEEEEEENTALEEVVIKATRSTRTMKRIPTRIEFIGGEELEEKAMMNAANISLVLRESTGIQIQQTSLSSVSSSIRIQGLDGRYTQILKDGFPLFGGFSGGLSINQIPPLDLSQFEIIKGSSATLYGGGAIAGLVNMVSKTPVEAPKLNVQLSQTHVGGSTANIFYSKRKNKHGYTLYGSGHHQNIYDPNDDGFSNLPKTNTLSLNPKLFYYPSEKETFWIGLNGTLDQREGGDVVAVKDGANGIHQYSEENTTARISSQTVYEKEINADEAFQIKNSISFFDRKLTTPNVEFSGRQWDVFSEANYTLQKQRAEWIFGGNFYSNSFKEKNQPNPRNQESIIYGVFANNTFDLSDQFVLESGFRTDVVPEWGVFPLPRFSMLWNANTQFSSRLGGGLGYKLPNMFTEEAATLNFENILPIDKNNLTAERSYGANIDFNYKGRISDKIKLSINQLFYLTSIDNSLLLNEQTNGTYLFENANGAVLSRGAETNIKVTYHDFKWFLSYAFINATLNHLPGNPQKPLTPKHQAGSVVMYENDKWRVGYETYYTGSQKLSSGEATNDFFLIGLLVQKHFKWGSPYVNFENVTDRRQSRFSPEVLPPTNNPQFPEIYAPTDGFVFTAGITFNPFGRKKHH
jgi:iron complex outermembrane receptor protein